MHEYCPPEHTASEMERLVTMHHEHERHRTLPAPIEGRMAAPSLRADPSVRGRERTHRATPDELRLRKARRADTGDSRRRRNRGTSWPCRQADRGNLLAFAQMLETKAVDGLRFAAMSIENMLRGRHAYFHMNGDISTKEPRNGWTRHRGTNGRESVIDTAAGTDEDPRSV